uniref:Potassium channel domain-containing protein n=1 Tax=Strigamia maritima TaxID=126957 RepID=T1JN22_STRMM
MGLGRSHVRVLILLGFYLLFLTIGASIFSAIEAPKEVEKIRDLRDKRIGFLQKFACVTGYGHVTPLSEGGKIFCIIYALLGIPLNMMLLMSFVQRLMIPVTFFLQFLNSRLGHLYQPFNIRMLHLTTMVLFVFICFYVVPALVFSTLEPNWGFLDSLYYCFISLTTIGLGDYIPGDNPNQPYRPLYKVSCSVYLLIGLTFMMLIMTLFCDIPQLNFSVFFLVKSDEIDPEKLRLHSGGLSGPKYTPQIDDNIRENIRVKPRPGGDTSSPEDPR